MGDVAELVIEGILCQSCGEFIDDDFAGYPRDCGACADGEGEQ